MSDTESEVSCDDKNFHKEDLGDLREQVIDKEHREQLAYQEEALSLLVEGDFHQRAHDNYTKLLADLANVDEVIKDKDKALILLNSLLYDDYETCILKLMNGKQSFAIMKCRMLL